MMYDCTQDTLKHIRRVQTLLKKCAMVLIDRGIVHDLSKLSEEEKPSFDKYTPMLKDSVYGSDEYRGFLREMKPAIKHHQANNSHHPEYYQNGITGMSLFDLMEMLCDWQAAGERHADGGNLMRSLELNTERFSIPESLVCVLENTITEMQRLEGWKTRETQI